MRELVSSEPVAWNGRVNSIETPVPGLAGLVFRRVGPSSYVPPKASARKRSKTPAKASAKASVKTKKKKSQRSSARKGENA